MPDFELIGDQLGPLGWALYHFLWQGMLVVSLYSLACLVLGEDARWRYALACFFLMVAILLPACQVWMILNRHHGVSLGIGPPERLLPWMTWAALVWGSVAGVISIRIVIHTGELNRLWLANAIEDIRPNEAAKGVARQVGLKDAPRVLRSTATDVMAVIGAWRPFVLVPAEMPDSVSDEQFRALLAHEMAHVARRDPVVNFCLSVMESLVFFHPAVMWLTAEVRRAREYCCDDIAVQSSGDALAYARGLTALARLPGLGTRAALYANGGDLKARVVRLVLKRSLAERTLSDTRRSIVWLAATGTMVAAAKLLCRLM